MRRAVVLLVAVAVLGGSAAAWGSTSITKKQAIAIVRGILDRHAAACHITAVRSIVAESKGLDRWRVTAQIRDNGYADSVIWTVVNRHAVPNGPLAAEIGAGCP
jgi:hypothetical protein